MLVAAKSPEQSESAVVGDFRIMDLISRIPTPQLRPGIAAMGEVEGLLGSEYHRVVRASGEHVTVVARVLVAPFDENPQRISRCGDGHRVGVGRALRGAQILGVTEIEVCRSAERAN